MQRHSYVGQGLEEFDTTRPAIAPLEVLQQWWLQANADERVYEPGAIVFATVDPTGLPDARMVLMRELTEHGLTFYTSLSSAKAQQLSTNPRAAAVLPWHAMYRQVRLRGVAEEVSREAAAAYFASRPQDSRIASAVSRQSAPLSSRAELATRVENLARSAGDQPVPLPDSWGGYLLRPIHVEAWVGQPSRLHDRVAWRSRDGEPALLNDPTAWYWQRLEP